MDAPVWRTLGKSLLNPGKVATEFISGEGGRLLGPVPFYLSGAVIGVLLTFAGPISSDSDLQISGIETRSLDVSVYSDFAVSSMDELPENKEVDFFWGFEPLISDKAENFVSQKVLVDSGGTASVSISIPDTQTLNWVQLVCLLEPSDSEQVKSEVWTKDGGTLGEVLFRVMTRVESNPTLSLLVYVPLLALVALLFSIPRRKPFLQCLVFSSYLFGAMNFAYLPWMLIWSENAAPDWALKIPLLPLLWLFCRGLSTFCQVKWQGWIWRILLLLVLPTLSLFVFADLTPEATITFLGKALLIALLLVFLWKLSLRLLAYVPIIALLLSAVLITLVSDSLANYGGFLPIRLMVLLSPYAYLFILFRFKILERVPSFHTVGAFLCVMGIVVSPLLLLCEDIIYFLILCLVQWGALLGMSVLAILSAVRKK
jgi:hypothetical protein|tara:strand:+ start:190 stop:1473 length:1284 start_codon:yes stop_codon:yes gene_type:complete